MRYRVDTQTAAGLVEAGTMVHAAVASSGSTGEVRAWMNVLQAGGEPESRLPEPGVDSIFCVVAGQVRAVVEARECVAGSGATFVVRADERYSLCNAGDSEARALEIQVVARSDLLAGHADTCSDEGRSGRGED